MSQGVHCIENNWNTLSIIFLQASESIFRIVYFISIKTNVCYKITVFKDGYLFIYFKCIQLFSNFQFCFILHIKKGVENKQRKDETVKNVFIYNNLV